MKKISEYQNEEALDLLADILEPMAKVFADKEMERLWKSNSPKIKLVQVALKKHKKEIIEILATLDGVKVSEYKGNLITMTKSLLELLNDEGLGDFFTSLEQTEE